MPKINIFNCYENFLAKKKKLQMFKFVFTLASCALIVALAHNTFTFISNLFINHLKFSCFFLICVYILYLISFLELCYSILISQMNRMEDGAELSQNSRGLLKFRSQSSQTIDKTI